MNRRQFVAGVVSSLGLAQGCARRAAAPSLKIGVVPMGTTHRYWLALHAGAALAATELGVQVFWPAAFRDGDAKAQFRAIRAMRSRGVAALAVAPIDDGPVSDEIRAASDAGLAVLSCDTAFRGFDLPYVGSDNELGGRLAGQYLGGLIKSAGRVLALRTSSEAISTQMRVKGFIEGMASHPDITVIDDVYAGSLLESAFVKSHELLDKYDAAHGGIAGIFCPNEISIIAMMRALENVSLDGKIPVVGFDRSPWITSLFVNHGKIEALVIQDPNSMGYLSVKMLEGAVRGVPIPRQTLTQVELVTRDMVSQPAVRKLLYPSEFLAR